MARALLSFKRPTVVIELPTVPMTSPIDAP